MIRILSLVSLVIFVSSCSKKEYICTCTTKTYDSADPSFSDTKINTTTFKNIDLDEALLQCSQQEFIQTGGTQTVSHTCALDNAE